MTYPFRFVAFIYTISIFTGVYFDVFQGVDDRDSAIIAGIYAPILYCLLFSFLALFYRLILRRGLARLDPDSVNFVERLFLAAGGLISGILIGGVIGLLIGAVFNIVFLAFVNVRLILEAGAFFTEDVNEFLLEAGIYLFGLLGAITGGVMGAQVPKEMEPVNLAGSQPVKKT